jgi:flagellar export protein FliJ
MKPFRFRGETLLRLREQRRDAAQVQLAEADRRARDAAGDLDRVLARHEDAQAALAHAMRAGGNSTEFQWHRNWIVHLCAERERCREVLKGRTAEVSDAGARLRAAHQQVRVLERLRERMRRRYEADARRQEYREIDALATLQYARRQREGGIGRDG